jgi:vancomycin resistance protein YoaR
MYLACCDLSKDGFTFLTIWRSATFLQDDSRVWSGVRVMLTMPPPLPSGARRTSAHGDQRLALVVALAMLVAAAGLSAYLLWLDPQAHASIRIETFVLGEKVLLGGESGAAVDPWKLSNQLARTYLHTPITLQLGKATHSATRAGLGVRVDLTALSQLLRSAADPSSPLRRLHAQQRGEDSALELPVPAHLVGAEAEAWLRSLATRFDEPAHAARADLGTGVVRRARSGHRLDVQATLDALDDAVFRGATNVRAVVSELAPESAATPARNKVDVTNLLGSYESNAVAPDRTRIANLAAAARKLDGVLIAPGATFDLRALLGPTRGDAKFITGPVHDRDGDALDNALGQVASTVYAAALFAGLPIVEQHPRPRPARDIELGLDAAIDARRNLRFQNDLKAPLVLGVTARGGNVYAVLRGAKLPENEQRAVEVVLSVEDIAPYAELSHLDASLPDGVRVIARRGVPGLRVLLKRSVHAPSEPADAADELSSTYPPSPRVVRVGTGNADLETFTAQAGDTSDELHLDEYVALSMRPGYELPEPIERRPGRTSEPDWTASVAP